MAYDLVQKSQNSLELDRALENAADIIEKGYLEKLDSLDIVSPGSDVQDIDLACSGKLYRLSRLVMKQDDHFLEKLLTVVNTAYSSGATLATVIRSNGSSITYDIGILSKKHRTESSKDKALRSAAESAFSGAVMGNFPGSELKELDEVSIRALQEEVFGDHTGALSSVSGLVSRRDTDSHALGRYVQGIEHLTDSMLGKTYTLLMIADPISPQELHTMQRGYEMISTQLSTFSKITFTTNTSQGTALSESQSSSIANGISEGVSLSQSHSTSKSRSWGAHGGLSLFGIVQAGGSYGRQKSDTESHASTRTHQTSSVESTSTGRSSSSTQSKGNSVQVTLENRSIKTLIDRSEQHIGRLAACESYGAFNCCTYVLAERISDSAAVAETYSALMRGEDSFLQSAQINHWQNTGTEKDLKTFRNILTYLSALTHPVFYLNREFDTTVTPASVLNGRELSVEFGLPRTSIDGVTVMEMVPFGRNVQKPDGPSLSLGHLWHMGKDDRHCTISLDRNSLTAHMFVTGSTGAGKSNTVYHMISQLYREKIPFLVIEPAKGEYKHVFGNLSDVSVFGTNPAYTQMLKINPFQFPNKIHVLEHIDRLIEILNVCWPMYAAMPAVLKDALLHAYENCGWDLTTSQNIYAPDLFPTFADLLDELSDVIRSSAYSEEVKGNYTGSLITRVKSLTNGLNGQIFCADELENRVLFDQNTIIDLSRIGSAETKSLIMGVLIMRLNEYRMSCSQDMNLPLCHVTVLEEAHNILKRTSSELNPDGSNMIGKSVEMISNTIAEMRTYGEGFIIADQSPGAVDISAIRNTNTKILMRLPDERDRYTAGKAAALTDAQLNELARLPRGVAAVYQNDWLEPVLCHIDHYAEKTSSYRYVPDIPSKKHTACDNRWVKREILKLLMYPRLPNPPELEIDRLERVLPYSSLLTKNKITVEQLIKEYQDEGHLKLWDNAKFKSLAQFTVKLLGCGSEVETAVREAIEFDDLTERFTGLISDWVHDTDDDLVLSVSQCFMRYYTTNHPDEISIYSAWTDHCFNRNGV